LVDFIAGLKIKEPALASFILQDSGELLRLNCQAISHRILRTPKNERKDLSVMDIIDRFREYGRRIGNDAFEPLDFNLIRIGKIIDSSSILHSLFLRFKKMFPDPVIK
jgi:hypothetical protein